MIEITLLNYLKDNLTYKDKNIPCYLEKPLNKPDRYVVFEKTSSSKQNHINQATFAFQSYGESMYHAAGINESLKVVLEEMIELGEIGSVRLNSDYNYTDTETKEYRYQAVFDIYY